MGTEVNAIPCPSDMSQITRLHYDSEAKVARAPRDLAAGTIVQAIPHAYLARARRGDAIAVVQRAGSITISQKATVLTDTVEGHPLWVRTTDGRVLTIPVTQGTPQ